MSTHAQPDLSSEATETAVHDAMCRIGAEVPAQELTEQRRRRLRELLVPQANGDQDTW